MPLGHQGRQAAGAGVRADAALGTRGPASSVKTRRSRPGRWGSAGAARHCPRRPAKRTVLGPGRLPWEGWHTPSDAQPGARRTVWSEASTDSGVLRCPSCHPSPRPAQQRGCSACLQPAAPGPALSRFPCGHTRGGVRALPPSRRRLPCQGAGVTTRSVTWTSSRVLAPGPPPPSPRAAVPTPERWIRRWAWVGPSWPGRCPGEGPRRALCHVGHGRGRK